MTLLDALLNDDDGLSHEVRMVSPTEAAQLLQRVRNTASADQRQIATYARDMTAGAWKLNGDPLILDKDGVLLSGRLRLHACIRAGTAFPTLIVRNVDPAHFDTIDAVRRRTVADVLSIRREKDGRALAAALTVLWRFGNDDFVTQSKRVSAQSLLAILEANPDVRYSVKAARPAAPFIPSGLGGALHFLFSRVDPTRADSFFVDIGREDADPRSPAHMLRRHLDEGIRAGGMRNQVQLAGTAVKAWEAYRAGRTLPFVRYSMGNEQFPKISGLGSTVGLDGVKHSLPTNLGPTEATRPLSELKVRVEIISPSRAQELLDRNDRNRAIAGSVVAKYARDMRNGAWALNGQTIKIGATGRLLDGQHRCAAAVKANVSFPAIVVDGLDEEVFDTFDVGRKRSVSAILKDRGETNTALLAAVLRNMWLYENNLITVRNVPPTVNELIEVLDHHPGIRSSIRFGSKIRDISSSIVLALHYLFCRVNSSKADEFVDRLGDGVMLSGDSPVLRLRDILLDDRANRKRRLAEAERAALIIKAWNAFAEGRPLRQLSWRNYGERREAFPLIHDLDLGGAT